MTGDDLKTVEALIPKLNEGGDKAAKFVAQLTGAASTANNGPIATDIDCDECGKPMVIRNGKRGKFLRLHAYPKCRNTADVPAKLVEELGLNGNGKSSTPLPALPPHADDHEAHESAA